MRLLAVLLIATLELGGAFGSASASVETLEADAMILDLEVEVRASTTAVVAHLVFEDDPQIALPLLDRGGGVFGITTELPPKNYAVVFEAIGAEDGLSTAALLSDLGADLTPDAGDSSLPSEGGDDDGLSPETRRLGWLALGLAAAALSALAFWVIIGRDKKDDAAEEEE